MLLDEDTEFRPFNIFPGVGDSSACPASTTLTQLCTADVRPWTDLSKFHKKTSLEAIRCDKKGVVGSRNIKTPRTVSFLIGILSSRFPYHGLQVITTYSSLLLGTHHYPTLNLSCSFFRSSPVSIKSLALRMTCYDPIKPIPVSRR